MNEPKTIVEKLRRELSSTGDPKKDEKRDFYFHVGAEEVRVLLKYIKELEMGLNAPQHSLGGF